MVNIRFNVITSDDDRTLKNLCIGYVITETIFGKWLIGFTTKDRKICYVSPYNEERQESEINYLKKVWPEAIFEKDVTEIGVKMSKLVFGSVLTAIENDETLKGDKNSPISDLNEKDKIVDVLVRGTDLQVKVWKELAKLKKGSTITYGELAARVGKPKAVRAVASAVARNRVGYLLPCHRIVHKSKNLSKYEWGPELKQKILNYEADR